MAGASINVSLPTVEEAKPIFDKLAEGGQITMPWAATFWTPGFGTLTDKFGIRWMVGVEPAPSAG
jgi:PhnB protein